jgi:hypothetical protein
MINSDKRPALVWFDEENSIIFVEFEDHPFDYKMFRKVEERMETEDNLTVARTEFGVSPDSGEVYGFSFEI